MKQKIVNGRWLVWVTDAVADWDGGTGDYSARRGWEFERFESFRRELFYGDIFFDVGAEHGWISAIIAREFVGAENMVLFEPSPEFWPNIRKVWQYNGLADPLDGQQCFIDAKTTIDGIELGWPTCAKANLPETPGMAYRSIGNETIASITIDDYVKWSNIIPTAINIDIEGAELLALQGAEATLRKNRPLVWVSVHPDLSLEGFGITRQETLDFMKSKNYKGTHLGTDHEEHWLFKANP